ncbi:MAG TPA: hypothetical protein VFE80_14710, partial [Beijerinckiaceae bacterium]|nr:hypothetical protein [Beijerinckiaceae bacterium]
MPAGPGVPARARTRPVSSGERLGDEAAAEAMLGMGLSAAPAEVPDGGESAAAADAAEGVMGPGPRERGSAATRPAPDSGGDDTGIGGAGAMIAAGDWPGLAAV